MTLGEEGGNEMITANLFMKDGEREREGGF